MNPPFADMVAIGRLVKPRGLRGEVVAEVFSDRPDRFLSLERAYVPAGGGGAREVVVTSCWKQKDRFVLKLLGVDTLEEAEKYRDMELRIAESDLPSLPKGSYYHHQLVGLSVEDPTGRALGEVSGLLETGGDADVLVVRGASGETLIPLAEPFVRRVDLANRRLVASPQEWVDAEA